MTAKCEPIWENRFFARAGDESKNKDILLKTRLDTHTNKSQLEMGHELNSFAMGVTDRNHIATSW